MIDQATLLNSVMRTTTRFATIVVAFVFGAVVAGWNPIKAKLPTPQAAITTADPLAAFALAIETCDRGHGLQPFDVSVSRDAITCHYAPVNVGVVPAPVKRPVVKAEQ
jgi:hypothetical protein